MAHRHPQATLLQRFLRGEATPAEVQDLVWHLVEACPDCARVAAVEGAGRSPGGAVDGVSGERISDSAYDDLLSERMRDRLQPTLDLVTRARSEAPALMAELSRHPIQRQRLLIHNTPRFHTLPLADLLLETAWERGLQEPSEAEGLIFLAMEILDRIDPATFGAGLLNDLRGRAWAYRGNFLRIQSALRESDEAFCRAEEILELGTGDPLEAARLLGLKATLRRVQWKLDEAREMTQESLEIYQALGEKHLAGRTLVTQAIILDEQGDPAGALEVLREAQGLIEPERDPYLVRVIHQNLMAYLVAAGHYEEAMSLIPGLRHRVVEGGNRIELLRLRWQEGKLHLALGHESRAEAAFLEVRKGFVEQGIAHDAASVSLELASLYLRQGRTVELRDLARQLVPIFQSRDLHQEAIAALLLFQRTVEMETLTLRMVEEIADVVRKSRGKPLPRTQEPS